MSHIARGKEHTAEPISHDQHASLQSHTLKDFKLDRILGTGSFGRVSLARHIATGRICAIKALSKANVVKNQQTEHLRAERDVLTLMNFPFVVQLLTSFHDEECVYFVMEFSCGGEFFRHLKARGRLPEDSARFYAAEVLLTIEYLHRQNIIYRDLKPENLLLDGKGFIKMTDFGFAKVVTNKRTYTLCGTPDYLAPEIILNKGHSKPVDWWAFGVLVFEMIAGYPPFFDEDVTNTYKKIVKGVFAFPSYFPATARDLVRKLLQADLSKRIGNLSGGVADIKTHPWFRTLDWDACLARRASAPIKPLVKALDDASNFDDYVSLPPMRHDKALSAAEKQLFADF
ncbi:TPA: hypothetical protein ACH3X3_009153 [Trebouxia sp. C0006]